MQLSITSLVGLVRIPLASAVLLGPVAAFQAPADLSARDVADLRRAWDTARHRVRPVPDAPDAHRARNPGQGWRLDFDGRGFTTRPDGADWLWGLQLEGYGRGSHQRSPDSAACARVDGQRLTYTWSPTLDEWFVNDGRGLEHGFTLHAPPEGEGALTFTLGVRGGLVPVVDGGGRDVRFVDERGNPVLTYSGLTVFDATGRTLPARFEPRSDALVLTVDERGARYPITIDPVVQEAYVKASNTDALDQFGHSVAISGDTVVVGALYEDSRSVGVNGDETDNTFMNAGAAYVFVRNAGVWTQQAYLKASNTDPDDNFGISVAIDGDTIVVGAAREDGAATGVNGNDLSNGAPDAGAAYVFVRNAGVWTQEAYLKASNTDAGDEFGMAVAVEGDTVVVGAVFEASNATGINGDETDNSLTGSGAAYIFVRSGTTWTQEAYVKSSNADSGDRFGTSATVQGDTVAIGSLFEDSNAQGINGDETDNTFPSAGAVYVFTRSGTTWTQDAYVKASNAGPNDRFGRPVMLDNDTLVVGALRESSNATGVNGDQFNNLADRSGAAYVFVRNAGVWSQQAYLKASNTESMDFFGSSVAVSGDTVVVGAHGEDSDSDGVNSWQGDNSATLAGAAYVFTRSGTTWSQLAYLKATNSDASDEYGQAVAVEGDVVVVTGQLEDSNAVGVGGDETDNSAPDAGSFYSYTTTNPIRPFCIQTKPTSVAGCTPTLSVTGPSLSSDFWMLDNVPMGPNTSSSIAIFIYSHGPGMGISGFSATTVFGDLCLTGFLRSSSGCPSIATNGTPDTCTASFPAFSPDCNGGALGIQPGDGVNVQAWYRDADVGPEGANFSNAVFYTATP